MPPGAVTTVAEQIATDPGYLPVTLPEKPAEAIAAGRPVVCTFCGERFEHNEVGAVSGYTAACNACYDAGEPDGVQE